MAIIDLPTSLEKISLFTVPYYGYGWSWKNSPRNSTNSLPTEPPDPYWITGCKFIYIESEIVGVSGKIHEGNHEFNGWTSTCCVRCSDPVNLRDVCAECLIWISRDQPKIAAFRDQPVFYWVRGDAEMLVGYATLALDPKYVERRLMQVKAYKEYSLNLKRGAE